MRKIRKSIYFLVSVVMVLCLSAATVFGETEVPEYRGEAVEENSATQVFEQKGASYDENLAPRYPEVKINRKKAVIGRSHKLRLKAFCYPGRGTPKNFRWISSNWRVARVTENGTVWGIRPGRAKIMVLLRSAPQAKAVCTITVGYNIKYYVKGGKLSKGSPRVYFNERVTLKSPKRKGYKFKGWYTNKKLTKKIAYIEKNAKKDYTLYAKWQKKQT